MPPDSRTIECRGGPVDGKRVDCDRVDGRGAYYEEGHGFAPKSRRLALYLYRPETDCLHYVESIVVRNGSVKS